MKKIVLLLGTFIALAMPKVSGQAYFCVTPGTSKHALYVNFDRFYNFNNYEKHRVGAGLYYTVPLGKDSGVPAFETNLYGAYGTQDGLWKAGGDVAVRINNRTKTKFLIGGQYDLEQAASRKMDSYRLLDVATNNSYLAWQFSAIRRITGEVELTLPHSILTLQGRFSREQYLFDNHHSLYQVLEDPMMPVMDFIEYRSTVDIRGKWRINLALGAVKDKYNTTRPVFGDGQARFFARVLAQYYDTKSIGKLWNLNIFAQAGASTKGIPYSRMFDLGGCGGSYYYFRNTLLTVLPGEFISNNFAYFNVRLIVKKPLWNTPFSKPVPFVQLSGLWGNSWDKNGELPYYSLLTNDFGNFIDPEAMKAKSLMQPSYGLLEPSLGISNLLRWNAINISIAIAYRLAPPNAPYYRYKAIDNFAYMVGAAINL